MGEKKSVPKKLKTANLFGKITIVPELVVTSKESKKNTVGRISKYE